jgi:ribosomal protein S20
METLIVHPENKEQLNALKTFMKAFKISFKEGKDEYDPAFVDMILKGEEEIKAGKGTKVDTDNLWK